MNPPRVLVLMGGPDQERPVSLDSGRAVAAALRRDGRFAVDEAIIDAPDAAALAALVRAAEADVVFPVLHGAWGEGGPLQAHLDAAGVPYVGAGPAAARAAMDKDETKRRAAAIGIATPPAVVLEAEQPCPLDPPLVLKPVDDGSSLDLRICHDDDAITTARALLHPRRGRLLAERFIGGRELTVGVVLGVALPAIEIVPAAAFYDYDAKYARDDTEYIIDPDLPAHVNDTMITGTLALFKALDLRDLARADFILDGVTPWLLEINTMPGFTDHSLVPKAAAAAGRPMPALCGDLVAAALARSLRSQKVEQ